jgi:hypothetical protein
MAGHRNSQPRRDQARDERMRARIAGAADEFEAMTAAFDWVRVALRHLDRSAPHGQKGNPRAAEARRIASELTNELVTPAKQIAARSDAQ